MKIKLDWSCAYKKPFEHLKSCNDVEKIIFKLFVDCVQFVGL